MKGPTARLPERAHVAGLVQIAQIEGEIACAEFLSYERIEPRRGDLAAML